MQRFIFLILFFFLGLHTIMAQPDETPQKFKIVINGGIVFFNESDLKQINADVIKILPFNVQTVNNFPSTFNYGASFIYILSPKFSIGPSYQFYTTGSRIGAKDYSGSYSFDQIISAHSLGIQTDDLLISIEKTDIYFENIVGIHFARLKIEEKYRIDVTEQNDTEQFNAYKPFIYPGLKLSFPLTSSLGIAVKAGYSLDMGEIFKLSKNSQAKPANKASFSGLRLAFAIEYGQ